MKCRRSRGQLNDPETFSQGDEARVGGAERQVRVLLDQLGAAIQVGHDEVGQGQETGGKRT